MDELSALVSFRGLNQHKSAPAYRRTRISFRVSRFHKTPPEPAEEGMKLTKKYPENYVFIKSEFAVYGPLIQASRPEVEPARSVGFVGAGLQVNGPFAVKRTRRLSIVRYALRRM